MCVSSRVVGAIPWPYGAGNSSTSSHAMYKEGVHGKLEKRQGYKLSCGDHRRGLGWEADCASSQEQIEREREAEPGKGARRSGEP